MADNTTELEVLDQIVDVLGGQSGQYETVVPTLQQIRDLLGGGGGGGGYNPSLSVGRADALTGADSTAQWATRVTAGNGAATVRSVQGNAVAWNQLVVNGGFDGSTCWGGRESNISVADGVATITPTSDGTARGLQQLYDARIQNAVTGHKYLIAMDFKCNVATNLNISFSGNSPVTFTVPNVGAWNHCGVIWAAPSGEPSLRFYALTSATLTTTDQMQFKNAKAFDLTQMFGSGNEPTTVAEFERMYPEAYYPYSAPTLKPVQIAGIQSTDAQGGELDAIEWTAQTLRAAGSVRDELTADELVTRVGVVDLGTLTWTKNNETEYVQDWRTSGIASLIKRVSSNVTPNLTCVPFTPMSRTAMTNVPNAIGVTSSGNVGITTPPNAYATAADLKAAMSGVLLFYELDTPTTTPISPALPMTYKVQAGGSESIIVPSGEISAIPVLTVAEGESAAELVMDALACIATPDGPTATANHAVGTYLTMQGKLYKVTSAIAVGESIVAGTNVTETTVMAEVLSLIQ